jgi:hypothetical protein
VRWEYRRAVRQYFEKPYSDGPLPDGVVAHVQMSRSARTWIADVEAYLVERGLTAEVAPIVCDMMDAADAGKFYMLGIYSLSLERAVDLVATALKEQ